MVEQARKRAIYPNDGKISKIDTILALLRGLDRMDSPQSAECSALHWRVSAKRLRLLHDQNDLHWDKGTELLHVVFGDSAFVYFPKWMMM